MLSEEEKKIIERVEDTFYENKGKGINSFQKITLYEDGILDILKLLNIVEKLQKEKEEYKKLYEKALGDVVIADKENIELKKQIDLMSEYIYNMQIECNVYYKDKKEVKKIFENKAKGENK